MEIKLDRKPFELERLQREVNILLISDLHYDVGKTILEGDVTAEQINDALIKQILSEKDWIPDIVIVAGDLVNQNDEKSYKHYFHLLERLKNEIPYIEKAVFSTPGNHDVYRAKKKAADPFLNDEINSDPSIPIGQSYTGCKIVDRVFTMANRVISPGEQIKRLSAFEKEYFETYLAKQKDLEGLGFKPVQVDHPFPEIETIYYSSLLGVTLASFNSSWFCNLSTLKSDRNNLFLVNQLVKQNLAALPVGRPVISFMHHPFYFLHESEHIYPGTTGAPDVYNNFTKVAMQSQIILAGHVHGELQDPTHWQDRCYMITNGTTFTNDKYDGKCFPYTYAMLKINKQLNHFSFRKYRYYDREGFYCINPTDLRHFPLSNQSGTNGSSLELERVRVLEYFSKFVKDGHPEQEIHFFIYQLKDFDALFDPELNPVFEYEITKNVKPYIDLIEIRSANRSASIYKIKKKDLEQAVKVILSDKAITKTGRQLYFSLDKKNYGDAMGNAATIIESDRKLLRSIVLGSKIQHASINLLYH